MMILIYFTPVVKSRLLSLSQAASGAAAAAVTELYDRDPGGMRKLGRLRLPCIDQLPMNDFEQNSNSHSATFDVVICGAGLAGLTLARQLKLELPELSVAVVDRLARPLPEAAFKVGESSIELGTYYFGQVLKLEEYFRECHLPKLGLRFFMGRSEGPIEERPEAGLSVFPPVPAYQIDRGRLENDLREIVGGMGVTLFEGAVVDDIVLAEEYEPHVVKCRRKDGGGSFSLASRWVVDALGRRRLLQTKLGLKRATGHQASAAWWRYHGRIDVEDMAARGSRRWRDDVVEDRYFSTNHLTNKGYWVWLIPLGSGNTSVGIVTDETIHPQATYGQSHQQSLVWLREHEPLLWNLVRDEKPLDFLSLKNYSYTSAQVYSHRRWSCVGEAGFFLDPLYSVGSDFIAIANTITVEMVRRERAGQLTEEAVAAFNHVVLDILFEIGLANYRGTYGSFGHAQVFTPKLFWDLSMYWAYEYQLYAQGLILQPRPEIISLGERYRDLNARVQKLFTDWAEQAPPRRLYVRADISRAHFGQLLALDLAARRSPDQALEVARRNLDRFEELAQVLFWQAVSECFPDHPRLKDRPWVDAWKISLSPEDWAPAGLFHPASAPRPLRSIRENLTGLFAPQSLHDRLIYNLPLYALTWGGGFLSYRVLPSLTRWLVAGKPSMWTRGLFVRDYPPRRGAS
jgi:flavin-dependent dehydrogenase